jgi:hypothetical protein
MHKNWSGKRDLNPRPSEHDDLRQFRDGSSQSRSILKRFVCDLEGKWVLHLGTVNAPSNVPSMDGSSLLPINVVGPPSS